MVISNCLDNNWINLVTMVSSTGENIAYLEEQDRLLMYNNSSIRLELSPPAQSLNTCIGFVFKQRYDLFSILNYALTSKKHLVWRRDTVYRFL